MSRNTASIHIKASDSEQVMKYIQKNHKERMNRLYKHAKSYFGHNVHDINHAGFSTYVSEQRNVFSLYSSQFSFEDLADVALEYCNHLDEPIIYLAFSYGILLFGEIKQGKDVLLGSVGEDVISYGLTPKAPDVERLARIWGVEPTITNAAAKRMTADQLFHEIESLLAITSNVGTDYFSYAPERFGFEELDINLFSFVPVSEDELEQIIMDAQNRELNRKFGDTTLDQWLISSQEDGTFSKEELGRRIMLGEY